MEKQNGKLEKYFSYILYILFIVGAIGHSIPAYRPWMIVLTPYTLMLTSMLVLFFELHKGNYGFFVWGVFVFIFTVVIESIGVKTGMVFGVYSYGSVLGSKVTGVPLIIGINWLFVITGSAVIASYAGRGPFLTPLLAAVFTVLFDLFLEPAAVKLGYWNWSSGIIPLRNYYAWLFISYFISYTFYFYKVSTRSMLAVKYFIVQLLFFIYLNLVL